MHFFIKINIRRPVIQSKECPLCTNPERVLYKESSKKNALCSKMCYECPFLEEKLQNILEKQDDTQLICTSCKTSLQAIKTGKAFGCMDCHELFGDLLIDEVLEQNHHVSYRELETSPSSCKDNLPLLHKELKEALHKEDYELAILLRDEIQEVPSIYNYS